MKKYLFLLLLPGTSFAQKLERYCEVFARQETSPRKFTIIIDYGKGYKSSEMEDFTSIVDALNYLGKQNWKLVSAVVAGENSLPDRRIYRYYLKQEYDATEPENTKQK